MQLTIWVWEMFVCFLVFSLLRDQIGNACSQYVVKPYVIGLSYSSYIQVMKHLSYQIQLIFFQTCSQETMLNCFYKLQIFHYIIIYFISTGVSKSHFPRKAFALSFVTPHIWSLLFQKWLVVLWIYVYTCMCQFSFLL